RRRFRWQDYSPVLVVEIVSDDDPDKDYVRNVALYAEVPSIKEYWVLDPGPDPDRPSLRVYRRRGKGWQKPIDVPFGGTYQTPRPAARTRPSASPRRPSAAAARSAARAAASAPARTPAAASAAAAGSAPAPTSGRSRSRPGRRPGPTCRSSGRSASRTPGTRAP